MLGECSRLGHFGRKVLWAENMCIDTNQCMRCMALFCAVYIRDSVAGLRSSLKIKNRVNDVVVTRDSIKCLKEEFLEFCIFEMNEEGKGHHLHRRC